MQRPPWVLLLMVVLALAACGDALEATVAPTQESEQITETPLPTPTPPPLPTPDPERLADYVAAEPEQIAILEGLAEAAATDAGGAVYMASTCVRAATPDGETGMGCEGIFPMAMEAELAAPGTLQITFRRSGVTQTWVLVQDDNPYTFTGDVQLWEDTTAQVMAILGERDIQASLTIEEDYDIVSLMAQYTPWQTSLGTLTDLMPGGNWPSGFADSWLALTEGLLGGASSPSLSLTMDEVYVQLTDSGSMLGIEGQACGVVALPETEPTCTCTEQVVPLQLSLITGPDGSLTVITSNGMSDGFDTFWPVGQNLWMRQEFSAGGLAAQTLSLADDGITVHTRALLYDGEEVSCELVNYTFLDAMPEWDDLQGIGGIVMNVAAPDESAAALITGEGLSGTFRSVEPLEGSDEPDEDGCYAVEDYALDLVTLVQPDGLFVVGLRAGDGLRVLMPEEPGRYGWSGESAEGAFTTDVLVLDDDGVTRIQSLQAATGQEIVCESRFIP